MVSGILLLYYQPLTAAAPTIAEHVQAIPTHSQFRVWSVNTALGFPHGLHDLRFRTVVLHYSLFGPPAVFGSWPDGLNKRFLEYLAASVDSYKIAFFQDEHHFCRSRFTFLKEYHIDRVYTLLDPEYWEDVYGKYTPGVMLTHTLTGYIDHAFVTNAIRMYRPDPNRTIDVGYRARHLPFYMGRGGQEKTTIAEGFYARARKAGLVLDIAVGENSRIYGDAWWRFLANCRGVIGVEAGVSIFDLDDTARIECDRLLAHNPSTTFEQAHESLLFKWDGKIEYRTISPRHFEAVALRVCQILFEGKYNGALKPWVHYLPLKKDLSNLDDIIHRFQRPDIRQELTANAYRDLIESGAWSYERFVIEFDTDLIDRGIEARVSESEAAAVSRHLRRGRFFREFRGHVSATRYVRFPGRQQLASAVRRLRQGSKNAL